MSLRRDRIRCLSFDCYGTLIDWEAGLLASLKPVLAAHAIDCPAERLLELFGRFETEIERGKFRPYREVLRAVLVSLGEVLGFHPRSGELETFAEAVKEWSPFPDSTPALKALSERFELIILSNVDDELFGPSQEKLGIRFDRVLTSQQIGSYKPDLQNFRILIEKSGFEAREMLHVAQSLFHDIGPAKSLGLSTVWVNRRAGRKGGGATPASEAVPDLTVPSMASLAENLLNDIA